MTSYVKPLGLAVNHLFSGTINSVTEKNFKWFLRRNLVQRAEKSNLIIASCSFLFSVP